ncbi:MAG: hypothetical protein ACRERD_28390, partial [Candidatus Binatia bacterium]
MIQRLPFPIRKALISVLMISVLAGSVVSLWALDIFGQSKSEDSPSAVTGRFGALLSLADTIKQVSPAVVNISTTQKVEQRRRGGPFGGPMPG